MVTIEDKILALVKMANPEDPAEYTRNIVKNYALEKINENIKTCSKCDLCQNNIKSIGYGNTNSKILVICDDVSLEQYNKGSKTTLPMMDSDGETFNRALGVINANKEALYIVNAVNCFPKRNDNGTITKRIPSVIERTMCKTHIDKIIKSLNPSVILTLGSISSNALSTDKIAIMESRGKEFNYNGYIVIPTFHPSFFREMSNKIDNEMMNMYKDDFLRDLYTAFTIAIADDPNCGIGNIKLPF